MTIEMDLHFRGGEEGTFFLVLRIGWESGGYAPDAKTTGESECPHFSLSPFFFPALTREGVTNDEWTRHRLGHLGEAVTRGVHVNAHVGCFYEFHNTTQHTHFAYSPILLLLRTPGVRKQRLGHSPLWIGTIMVGVRKHSGNRHRGVG